MLLVSLVLILVTAGIVLSINFMNRHNITVQAEEALKALEQNSGVRPSLRENEDLEPPEMPEEMLSSLHENESGDLSDRKSDKNFTQNPVQRPDLRPWQRRGQPPEAENAFASLSNYYVVKLTQDDEVEDWQSDRSDLYTDEQVQEISRLAVASGKTFGRIGTQYYLLCENASDRSLLVLDERLEILNAQRAARFTMITAGIACLLLCILAWFLISAMVRPVEDAFERQRQFVWDAGHELKTPLAVIGSNAQVLQDEIGQNEYLGYILSEIHRSDDLLKNLLTLARMDRGSVQPQLKKMDLSQAVLAVTLPFESSAFEEEKQLEVNVPEGIYCIGDEQMLQQLTVILLSNALKYSCKQGKIIVTLTEKRKGCELSISNEGPGIEAQDLKKIFDRFYRADTSHNREVEGFGLGLSIAKQITDAHHGTIRVKSEPDKETVFTVWLPI